MSIDVDAYSEDLIKPDSSIDVVRHQGRSDSSKKKARFDDNQLTNEQEYQDKEKCHEKDFEFDQDCQYSDDSVDSGPHPVTQDDHNEDDNGYERVHNKNDINKEQWDEETLARHSSALPNEQVIHTPTGLPYQHKIKNCENLSHEESGRNTNSNKDAQQDAHENLPGEGYKSQHIDTDTESSKNLNTFTSREKTTTSLLLRRAGGRRQSSGNSRSPPRRTICNKDIRHYTTMKSKDDDGHIKYDNISLKSSCSRTSGLLSNLLNLMSSRFIYESDPFDGTLRWCPKVTYSVVERATMPTVIDSMFGNPQKQTLPSYYYTSTDRNSARPRRGGSRMSRSSSAQSVSVGEKSLPPLDSPRDSPQDPFRHEIDAFIPEEEEETIRMKSKRIARSAKSSKAGSLPNILVSDHSLSNIAKGKKGTAKRPATSSSTKGRTSHGYSGKSNKL